MRLLRYKTKRMEAYMTTKDQRESMRYGFFYVLFVALFDAHLIDK